MLPGATPADRAGVRVRVPFGRTRTVGVVTALLGHSEFPADKLKPVEAVLDLEPLLQQHDIDCSLSSAGSCYDNAVVESFFASLKRERIRRRKYRTRDQARADVFDYIERFYNRQRRHSYVGNISPAEFEERTMRT